MKAKYNAAENTLQELPEIEQPLPLPDFIDHGNHWGDYNRDVYNYECNLEIYNDHVNSLRTIPCSPEAATVFKDGEVYEEGKDYEVKPVPYDMSGPVLTAFPLPRPVQEDDLQKIFDGIKAQCQNSLSDLTSGRGLSSKDYVRIYEDSVFEFIEHLKKEFVLTRKP
jgi:hypothetical protein